MTREPKEDLSNRTSGQLFAYILNASKKGERGEQECEAAFKILYDRPFTERLWGYKVIRDVINDASSKGNYKKIERIKNLLDLYNLRVM